MAKSNTRSKAAEKKWTPGVPVVEYELVDGAHLVVRSDRLKLCQCPFCGQILHGVLMEPHLRTRFLDDLSAVVGMCHALQISHEVRDSGLSAEVNLQVKCKDKHRSRTAIILEYGDPRDWK